MNISNSYCLACTTKPTQIEDEPYFVDAVTVLDKDFAKPLRSSQMQTGGRVVDTVYVVIDKAELKKHLK